MQVTPTNSTTRYLEYDIPFIDDLWSSRFHCIKQYKQERRCIVTLAKMMDRMTDQL